MKMTIETLDISRPLRRITVAIGLFEGPLAVRSALRDLTSHGIGIERIKIITSAATRGYDRLASELGAGADDTPIRRVEAVPGEDASACIHDIVRQTLAASGTTGSAARHDGESTFAIWGLERQANSLKQHLGTGGSVLIVRLETADEQRAVCSMLLHYADRGVQTHQLRYGRPPGDMVVGSAAQ